MKKYLLIMNSFPYSANTEIEAANYTEAKFKAFRWACDCSGDRLSDVSIYEVKGKLELSEELNPSPHSAMYFAASLDYETGKKRTREKKKQVAEQKRKHEINYLQSLLDTDNCQAIPYAEMLCRAKIISNAELKAIKKKYNAN